MSEGDKDAEGSRGLAAKTDSDGVKRAASNCQWFCELLGMGGVAGVWEMGPDPAAQHEGLSQCEQAQQALAGPAGQSESAVKTHCATANRPLNSMVKKNFTANTPASRADGRNYFFALFSPASIFLMNFLGSFSKSFLQSLQHSLISRS